MQENEEKNKIISSLLQVLNLCCEVLSSLVRVSLTVLQRSSRSFFGLGKSINRLPKSCPPLMQCIAGTHQDLLELCRTMRQRAAAAAAEMSCDKTSQNFFFGPSKRSAEISIQRVKLLLLQCSPRFFLPSLLITFMLLTFSMTYQKEKCLTGKKVWHFCLIFFQVISEFFLDIF